MNEGLVYIAESKDAVWVRIDGCGTFQNSHPIKNWLLAKVSEEYLKIFVDLANCKSMDSTFMGTITGLSLKMKRSGKGQVTMVNVTEHNRRLLSTLGLDRFIMIEEKHEIDPSLKWEVLPIKSLDKLTTAKHMTEAHEELLGTGSIAEKQFKAVHDMLKKDLQNQLKKKKKAE